MKAIPIPFFVFLLQASLGVSLQGQALTGAATRWSDSFREWILYHQEGEAGALELKEMGGDNWTAYRIRYRGEYGQTRLKWPDRADEWELRLGQDVVTIRAIYRGDPTQWRIIGQEIQFTFQAKHPNRPEEWQIRNEAYGQFLVYTRWQGDPREWIVEDQLVDERFSPAMRLAMLFTALVNSTPER